jgi:hypothetical protein
MTAYVHIKSTIIYHITCHLSHGHLVKNKIYLNYLIMRESLLLGREGNIPKIPYIGIIK